MKTYRNITPVEALKRLAKSGKPIEKGLWFKDRDDDGWQVRTLLGVQFTNTQFLTEFDDDTLAFDQCAELIEESPKPWTFETAPKGCVLIRIKDEPHATLITHWQRSGVMFGDGAGVVTYEALAGPWQHSLDNGKTWLPCTR